MESLKEKQKNEAIKRMQLLRMSDTVIKEFRDNNKLKISDNMWSMHDLDQEQLKMVQEFEAENDSVVYHMIFQQTTIGDMYSFLFVSKYIDEWEMDTDDLKYGQTLAYVVNKTYSESSEFGKIGIEVTPICLIRTW